MTTTIDVDKGKIVNLSDISDDFDAFSTLLLKDKFESITVWN